jgi:hypothetical protein
LKGAERKEFRISEANGYLAKKAAAWKTLSEGLSREMNEIWWCPGCKL